VGGLCGGVIWTTRTGSGSRLALVFVLTGVPGVLFGIVTLDAAAQLAEAASWLAPRRRDWLLAQLYAEQGPEDESRRARPARRAAQPPGVCSWPRST